jgi:RHS repeat-associated protein
MQSNLLRTIVAVAILGYLGDHNLLLAEQGDDNPTGVSGVHNGNITTGGSYDPYTGNAVRQIDDIVVPGAVGAYPLKWTRYFNSHCSYHRGSSGGQWHFSYIGYAYEFGAAHEAYFPDGRYLAFGQPLYGVPEYDDNPYVPGSGYPRCSLRLPDGGQVIFLATDPYGHYAVSQMIDPYGQPTNIVTTGTGSNKQTRITEPGGRYLLASYDASGNVTQVQAFDGISGDPPIQSVTYTWASQQFAHGTYNVLTNVAYSDGSSAAYTYLEGEFRGAPICGYPYTPGGFPQYAAILSTCDDVRYEGPMRQIAYKYQVTSDGTSTRILSENHLVNGQAAEVVSSVTGDNSNGVAVETRGDGPTRTFNYHRGCRPPNCPPPDSDPCPGSPFPLDGKLTSYTDFQGHNTTLNYEADGGAGDGYISSVVDVNNHTTTYVRSGTWGITSIIYPATATEPNGSSISQTFWPDQGHPWYLLTRTNERGYTVQYHRNPANSPTNPNAITEKDYLDANGATMESETFAYNNFGQMTVHHMRNGAYQYFQYDGRGLLLQKTNPTWTFYSTFPSAQQEAITQYSYYSAADTRGGASCASWIDRLKTEVDPRGNSTTYEYDNAYDVNGQNSGAPSGIPKAGRGLVTKIRYPQDIHGGTIIGGTYKTFCYDKYGNKLWEQNELGQQTTSQYDDFRRITRVTDAVGNFTTNAYVPTGKTSSYITTSKLPFVTTAPEGQSTNKTTNFYYDPDWQKTRTQESPGTSVEANTYFGYDPLGNLTYVTDPRGTGANDPNYTTTTNYDQRNRKWHVTDPQGHITTFGYDPTSNITSLARPDGSIESKIYDELNRVTTDTIPKEGSPTSPTVSILNQFFYYRQPASTQMCGQLQKFIDGEGRSTFFNYDPAGNKTQLIYPDNSSQGWLYDLNYNLTKRTTVNGVYQSLTYDERNRKLTRTWSNAGILPAAAAENATFQYDAAGRLANATNGSSAVTRGYDAAGELTSDTQNVTGLGAINVQYTYTATKQTRLYVTGAGYDYTFGYDAMGRFQAISPTGGSVAFQYYYDAASNEVERNNLLNSVGQFYSRDNLSRMTERDVKLTTSVISSEAYGYDAMSRLASTAREDGKQDALTYWLDGELNTVQYAQPTPTPTVTPTPPPNQCAPVTFRTNGGGTTTLKVTLSTTTTGATIFYTVSSLDFVTPTHNGGTVTGTTKIYTGTAISVATGAEKFIEAVAYKSGMSDSIFTEFDADNTAGGGGFSVVRMANINTPHGVTYYFDKAGNRTSVVDTGVTTTYTPNILNQYTGIGGTNNVTNGSEHELAAYQTNRYTYINDERLSQITSGTNTYQLAYDPLGRCVKRTLNNNVVTYYVYDGEKPILEYTNVGVIAAKNLYGSGIDEVLLRTDLTVTPNRTLYYQDDHEGSVTHLTDPTGAVVEHYRYDVFGAPFIEDANGNGLTGSAFGNRFMFTGREYTATYGVYEYRARAYHPGIGRFMSEDPSLFVHRAGLGKAPANWDFFKQPDDGDLNLFRYCGNDPEDFTDPFGLYPEAGPMDNFIAGLGDATTFGAATRVADFVSPGYAAAVDHSSLAYGIGSNAAMLTVVGEEAKLGAVAKSGTKTVAKQFSRIKSQINRNLAAKERRAFWKREAQQKASRYSPGDIERMQQGKPPVGADGHSVELHHTDGTHAGGVEAMSRTEHRLGDNYSKNHPLPQTVPTPPPPTAGNPVLKQP